MIDGLEADVVTLALAYDIDAIAEHGEAAARRLAEAPAAQQHALHLDHRVPGAQGQPEGRSRTGTISCKPGRRGRSRRIPKTSGGARWNYLAAWGYALRKRRRRRGRRSDFVAQALRERAGARFRRARLDDDVRRARHRRRADRLGERGVPGAEGARHATSSRSSCRRVSILAEPPVALVDKVVDKHGTRKVAEAYLEFLYTPKARRSPRATTTGRRDADGRGEVRERSSRSSTLFTIDDAFGGWPKAQKTHFADGGIVRPDLPARQPMRRMPPSTATRDRAGIRTPSGVRTFGRPRGRTRRRRCRASALDLGYHARLSVADRADPAVGGVR